MDREEEIVVTRNWSPAAVLAGLGQRVLDTALVEAAAYCLERVNR